jgi:hypothetical protein
LGRRVGTTMRSAGDGGPYRVKSGGRVVAALEVVVRQVGATVPVARG